MARNLDPTMAAGLPADVIMPVFLAMLTFRSAVKYCWTGVGNLSFGGNTFVGVGSWASIGAISEGIDVNAQGTSVTLSGLEKMVGQSPDFLSECLTDIRAQAPAKLWFGLFQNGALLGTPYLVFSGVIDKPAVNLSEETISITLTLENLLVDLGRATGRRYTSADQNLDYSDDSFFDWVEIENDIALVWGS